MTEREIYRESFGLDPQFEDKLFEVPIETLKIEGKTVSQLFLLPCNIVKNGKPYNGLIDYGIYQWDSRIRIAVTPEFRNRCLVLNPKARALMKHRSQYIILRAGSIINSDEVFWERRTDSLTASAKITVSSGNAEYLRDFALYRCGEIDSESPRLMEYLWSPVDERKEAAFEWRIPQSICGCCLYGNIEETGRIRNVAISADNGFRLDTGPLPKRGGPLWIDIDGRRGVRSVTIAITEYEGVGWGMAECEFFSTKENERTKQILEALSYGDTQWVQENIPLTKVANNFLFAGVRCCKFLQDVHRFLRRNGIRGAIDRVLRKGKNGEAL